MMSPRKVTGAVLDRLNCNHPTEFAMTTEVKCFGKGTELISASLALRLKGISMLE